MKSSAKAKVSFPDDSDVSFDIGVPPTEEAGDMVVPHPLKGDDERGTFNHILEDAESRILLTEHKKFLHRLVSAKHKELQSMGFHHMNGSSLRSIISERLDRSTMSLFKLEADITDATEDLTDFSEHRFDGHLAFDFDEEVRALEMLHSSRSHRGGGGDAVLAYDERGDNDDCNYDDDDDYEGEDDDSFSASLAPRTSSGQLTVPATNRKIPLSASLSVSLRGAAETWSAIRTGATTPVACNGCNANLHVLEDAEYVVCPECWTVGTVEYNVGGIMLESDGSSNNFGIALGVKADEILEWVEEASSKGKIVG